jgi:hypothetical protein
MVFILEACIVLDNSVAANALLSESPNATLVVLGASVHYDICLIRNAVNGNLAQRDVVSLDFGS